MDEKVESEMEMSELLDNLGKVIETVMDLFSSSPSHETNSVRAGNAKFSSLAAEKQLKFYPQKSCHLVFGTEDYKAKYDMGSEEEPMKLSKDMFCDKEEKKVFGRCAKQQQGKHYF